VGRLDDYLQQWPDLHDIGNPVLPQEKFSRHWDQEKYSNFRDMIHKYRGWIDEAYGATDEVESITNWQRVFDDEWGKSLESRALIEKASSTTLMKVNTSGYSDLVQAVKSAGAGILSNFKVVLPWVKPAHWHSAASGTVTVNVRATLHDREGGPPLREFSSGTPLPKSKHMLFEACSPTGLPYSSKDYVVQWQVVNTDRAAANANQLRGGFYRSDSPARRWERTRYRGVHWVQAFVVRRRDRRCVGKSNVFFVVIE
jgi:Adenylyl/Guanylyl and SMODS C-terminal sensor domain